jgi:hypothetical protein
MHGGRYPQWPTPMRGRELDARLCFGDSGIWGQAAGLLNQTHLRCADIGTRCDLCRLVSRPWRRPKRMQSFLERVKLPLGVAEGGL